MTSQQQADLFLGVWQSRPDLTPQLRMQEIDNFNLIAANSNAAPSPDLLAAQMDANYGIMAAEYVA